LLWLQQHHPRVFQLWSDNLARLDERRVEVQHALFRRVLGHLRVVDLDEAVVQRLLEAVVELSDPLSLSSSALESLSNEGSDVRLVGLLPAALDALRSLLDDAVRTRNQTLPLAPPVADTPPARPITAANVVPPQLNRSSPGEWRASLEPLKLDELKVVAWRYNNRVGKQQDKHIVSTSLGLLTLREALRDERVRSAALADEREWPANPSRDSFAPFAAYHLAALCRRAGLAVAGSKDELIERLCAAAGAPLFDVAAAAPVEEQAAASARAQRERDRRRWQTPLFGVIDVRNLPLSYRLCERPPQVSGFFLFLFYFFIFPVFLSLYFIVCGFFNYYYSYSFARCARARCCA
jgi:hypothetical protein